MADLTAAPFPLDDGALEPLPCTVCPHNSHNDTELQAGLDADAHVCTDSPCFEHKVKFFWQRKQAAAAANGQKVLTGDEAKKAIPPRSVYGVGAGYNDVFLDLDARADDLEFPEPEP